MLLIPNFYVGEKIEKAVIKEGKLLRFFFKSISLTLCWNSVKSLGFIVEEIRFVGVWEELESRKCCQREWVTKYLRLNVVLMWNSAPREKLNRYISGLFC